MGATVERKAVPRAVFERLGAVAAADAGKVGEIAGDALHILAAAALFDRVEGFTAKEDDLAKDRKCKKTHHLHAFRKYKSNKKTLP